MAGWNVLLRDHHPGYISWEQYEASQKLISETLICSAGPSGSRHVAVALS
jgi:hypothetical protein